MNTKLIQPSFTFIDLFSGIGGFRIALEREGGKCVGFSEIEQKAIEVYKDNFDTTSEVEIGDITKVNELPYADILTGGVPCQSWSIAGKMRGFEDPRGKLWQDTIKVTEIIKPKGFIYENVKGLADPRNKYNLDLIINEFYRIGYNIRLQVLNAFDYGLPQSRERLFIVGIKKELDKSNFSFPEKFSNLPFLTDILEGISEYKKPITNNNDYKNSFNMAAVANKGNFYIFSDIRNGEHTIHTWDLMETSQKEKNICVSMLKNRRKPIYGNKDGNPMSYKDISSLGEKLNLFENCDDNNHFSFEDIKGLVTKGILRETDDKYEFVNSKISSGINGVYRIFLPESHVFSTLTKSGSRDYVTEISIPEGTENKKDYFIKEIYLKKLYRQITVREGARLQGFPDNFKFGKKDSVSRGLLGNSVAINVVQLVANKLLSSIL